MAARVQKKETTKANRFANQTVFVHGPGAFPYMVMFKKAGFQSTDDIDKATIVCFTGGEDVNPTLYNEEMLVVNGRPMSGYSAMRDEIDSVVHGICCANAVLQVGVCRGGQFLNVMNGGRMWQDVDHHVTPHNLIDCITGEIVKVSSTHHQMMRPGDDGEIFAVARESSYKMANPDEWHIEYGVVKGQPVEGDAILDDVEVVWYPRTRSLCFQPHPEHSGMDECRDYFLDLIERVLV